MPEARPSRWVIRKRMLAAVSAFAIPLGFSGCSGEPVEAATEAELRSVESVRARLDSEAGKIGMPLDEVVYSAEDRVLVKQANNILMEECLAKSKINLSKDFGVFKPHPEDGRYGIWVERLADENGYNRTGGEPVSPDSRAPYDNQEGFKEAYVACREDLRGSLVPMRAVGSLDAPDAIHRIDSRAYGSAMNTTAWVQAKKDWRDCLQERGVALSEDENSWVPEVPSDLDQNIRTAKIDIECKNRTGLMQRVADLEAKFQTIYMARDPNAINKLRAEKAADVSRAREIVSRAGNAR